MAKQEEKLKRVMNTKDAVALSVGLIIGAGVMSLSGIAIGRTGTSVSVAYLISSVLTILVSLPLVQMAAASPTAGAGYKYASRMLGSWAGFLTAILTIPMFISLAVYSMSFAQYFLVAVPSANMYVVAGAVLTLFYVLNLAGTNVFKHVQNIIVYVLAFALAIFIVFGLPKVDYATYFSPEKFLPFGVGGLVNSSFLLYFALYGGAQVANMGSEMKDPGKAIPIATIGATIGVAIIYALIRFVASGVLPYEQVAYQPLSVVAEYTMPKALFWVFIIGGGLGATASTINGMIATQPRPLIAPCDDGWLPKKLGYINKRGVPVYLLTLAYITAMIPIIFRISIETVSDTLIGAGGMAGWLIPIALIRMMKKRPDLYDASPFKIPRKLVVPIAILGLIASVFQFIVMFITYSRVQQIVIIVFFLVVLVLGLALQKKVPIEDDLQSFQAE